MRVVVLAWLAALAACYEAPTHDEACTILCTTTGSASCPDEMSCVNGYCIADGETCAPTFQHVDAGNGFACALDEAGRRWCWGANDHHQVNNSDEAQIVYATLVDNSRWELLATGGSHACGIRLGGELYCWGGNDVRQVTGGVIGDVADPVRIASPNGKPWTFVATGYNSTCAIAEQLYCWGRGEYGQLGTGTDADTGVPTQVASTISDWESVSIGRYHACAISRSGGLHCWGYNYYGEVGNGAPLYTGDVVWNPTAITLAGATAVAVAAYSTCAVAADQLYCWGYQYDTVLGDPALTNTCTGPRAIPALSSGLTGWTTISASQYMSCALRADEVWCWGAARGGGGLGKGVWNGNGWGRVALGVTDVSLGWNANVDEESDTQDLDLACIVVDGKVQCWGDNRFGQLAQGDATMHPTPREIAGDHRWSTLVASDLHTCGITDAGELMCWGTMLQGQTISTISGTDALPCGAVPGVPCTLGEPTQVPFQPTADEIGLGDAHTCARSGTTLTCWGGNDQSQLGPPGTVSPVTVAGAWTKLYSTGSLGTCAVQNGETWCWGTIFAPQQPAAHQSQLDNAIGLFINATVGDSVIRGNQRTTMCYLDATNELWCYGDNSFGEHGLGAPAAGVCGNGTCDLDEDVDTCPGDCIGVSVCYTDSCSQLQVCYTDYDRCGDGRCNRGYDETCSSCAVDCGTCPLEATGRHYLSFGVAMLSSQSSVCGVRMDGHVECWGRNANGQVGATDPTTGAPIRYVYTPYEIPGLSQCTQVASGEATSCAICGGELWCWGSNRRGTVGAGKPTATPITTPRKVGVELDAGDRFVQISSGTGFSCARTEQGRGFCWGFHRYGALGTGATSANLPVDVRFAP